MSNAIAQRIINIYKICVHKTQTNGKEFLVHKSCENISNIQIFDNLGNFNRALLIGRWQIIMSLRVDYYYKENMQYIYIYPCMNIHV